MSIISVKLLFFSLSEKFKQRIVFKSICYLEVRDSITFSLFFDSVLLSLSTDFFLSGVVILAHKLRLNPDNLATPLAASIGDIVAIALFSFIVNLLFQIICKLQSLISV